MEKSYVKNIWNILWLLILVLGALIMLIPFVWMFLTSFKTFAETMQIPIVWLPKKFSLVNYVEVLKKLNFSRYYLNTIIMTVLVVVGQLFLCSLAAYSFARLKFPGRNFIFFSILCILMVPPQMTLIPRYVMMNSFNWIDTFLALVIPVIPSAYGTFFLRQFFMTLPKELEDSGKIDGCSYFGIYWNILLPLCTSALIAYGIINILWSWNELLWPLTITNSENMRVLSIAMASLQGQYSTEYQLLMAASVMSTIPMIVMFVVGQKYFISGIAMTGLKA